MLLRIRVRLPDRPGALGQVARTLGAAGADVVQMAVLERDNGRALDDFTVVWPAGAALERLIDGLGSVPGVEVLGVWPTVEPQGAFPDAAVIGQIAAVPEHGHKILTDAAPGVLSADWACLAQIAAGGRAGVVHVSAGCLDLAELPALEPLRPRAFTAPDGVRYAICPLGDQVLVVARSGAPPFHRTEVCRLEQLASAATAVLARGLVRMPG
ncbi:ACT domain-containing protein [Spirillospora albida]|uniref:ACT domain-containing protein n=1 Tax=Spirillospora albida TaxID=58123 RepID=UPI0004C0CC7F|nr:ACT domain-containing protein [Spirillospora albida]